MMTDFNAQVGQLLLNVLLLLLSGVAVALVAAIRKRVSADTIQIGRILAEAAVNAVEQVGARNGWSPEQKFLEALHWAREQASQQGIKVTDPQWETFIEAAVAELKQRGGELVATDSDSERSTTLKHDWQLPLITELETG